MKSVKEYFDSITIHQTVVCSFIVMVCTAVFGIYKMDQINAASMPTQRSIKANIAAAEFIHGAGDPLARHILVSKQPTKPYKLQPVGEFDTAVDCKRAVMMLVDNQNELLLCLPTRSKEAKK